MTTSERGNFADDYHALVVGEMVGSLKKERWNAEPARDERGDYVPSFTVNRHGRLYSVSVEAAGLSYSTEDS